MMASRLLLASILLFLIATSVVGQRERGREVRRRNRQSTTTTTTVLPPAERTTESSDVDGVPETSEGDEEKQICEGEPGCEWRCADQPDPSASCTCFCAPPDNPKEETSYDNSYFN